MDREASLSFCNQIIISHPSVLESYCQLVVRLLQHDTATLHLPECHLSDQKSSIEKVMEAVGSKNCRSLRLINTEKVDFRFEASRSECFFYIDDFFRAMPQLTNLQVIDLGREIYMEDIDLEELAQHTPNLV